MKQLSAMKSHDRHIWHFTLLADTVSPLALFAHLRKYDRTPSLFESVEGGEVWGTHTVVIADPIRTLTSRGKTTVVSEFGDVAHEEPIEKPFLDVLKEALATTNEIWHPCPQYTKDYAGPTIGFYGLLGFPIMHEIEPQIPVHQDKSSTDVHMMEPGVMFVYNNVEQLLHVLLVRDSAPSESDYLDAQQLVHSWLDAAASVSELPARSIQNAAAITPHSSCTKSQYENAVVKAKQAIYDGEAIQIVIAQRFSVETDIDPLALYRTLRIVNPSPYLFMLSLPDQMLIGSSPEVMVRLRNDRVSLRPIAGTRKRGRDSAQDDALEKELLADPKELAEHLMLVDLGRNDLGRIAKAGSVTVPDKFFVERYSHVMHIVSQVEAELDPRYDAVDVVRATFPAGTVSGAPKIRACQLIYELEGLDRGAYSGAVGYFDLRGNMDTCIVIRTFVHKPGLVSVTAGAGIVFDSDPATEYEESVNKAKALFTALGEAQ